MMKSLALLLALVMCGPAGADDVLDLIKQLDAENFQEREQAAAKLQALGKEAVPALVNAAGKGTLETTVRSIDILKKLMDAKDQPTAAEAKSALEKLAESENASTARRAKNALTPPPKPQPAPLPNRIAIGGFLPMAPAAGGNVAQRIRTSTINGVKTVEVEQGDRKVKIEEDPNKSIKVEITEKQNGKDVTEKFEAKTADDLKKNHPKGYAEYEKYVINNAVVQRNFARAAFPRAAVPGFQRGNGVQLEVAGRLLQSLGRNLESLADDNAIKGASNESREALKKEVADMKNRLAEMEKKLQSAIDADAKPKPAEAKPANAPDEKSENAKP